MRTLAPGADVLLYDGACSFCTRAAATLSRALPSATAARSFHDEGALRAFPGLDRARCEQALHLVRSDGLVFTGVEALVQALRGRWYGPLLRAYYLPIVRPIADAAYRAVAGRRAHLGGPGRQKGR